MTNMPAPSYDVYEPASIISYLPNSWQKEALAYGDYAFSGAGSSSIVVERKAWSDLVGSLKDGRLNEQLFRCLSNADITILLVEGWATSTPDGYLRLSHATTGWTWASIQNYLMSVQLAGVRIYLTTNEYETARCLIALWNFFAKERHSSLLRTPRFVPKCSEWRSLNLLSGIDGVDMELAKRLLQRFGTAQAVFNSSEKQLMEVQGIGRIKAKSIRQTLDEVWKEEGKDV